MFFLDQIHKVCKINNEEIDRKIDVREMPEMEPKRALKLFKDFVKNDNSYISDNFFGKELIIKTCKNCYTSYYSFQYIKIIQLDIKDNKIETNLEACLNNIERYFESIHFCPICAYLQNFNMSIKIF